MSEEQAGTRLAGLFSFRNVVAAVLSDLAESCWLITLSLSGAWLLSLTWILLMRCISGFMVWLSILEVIAILAITLALSASRLFHSQSDQVKTKTKHLLIIIVLLRPTSHLPFWLISWELNRPGY